ncbi:MAG: ABC transporter permease, partial [Thermoproteota archaeon]|nr:ABC transporter permease [Thermoproteota archaeon]
MTGPVESLSTSQILKEFKRSKSGIAGLAILLGLFLITIYAVTAIPLKSFTQWNNPNFWIDRPQSAMPVWINLLGARVPEHMTLTSENSEKSEIVENGVRIESHSYNLDFDYD